MQKDRLADKRGIAAIPILIALMALIVATAISISGISFNQNEASLVLNDSGKAWSYAESGARDALQKISRDITYTNTVGYFVSPTGVSCSSLADGCVKVQVHATTSPKIITATGRAGSSYRKIEVDAAYDSSYQITNTVWTELKDQPSAATSDASSVGATSATLNGWTNTNNNSATVWFQYASFNPGNCTEVFGTATSSATKNPATDPVSFSSTIPAGLSTGTTYYYCAIAEYGDNDEKVYGQVVSFTTTGVGVPPALIPPTVVTQPATDINDTSGVFHATLNGLANPNGNSTTGWFRYSELDPIVCTDTFGTRVPSSGGTSLGSGLTPKSYSETIDNLNPEDTYYVCAIASSAGGTGLGSVMSFTTPEAFPKGMSVVSTDSANNPLYLYIYKYDTSNDQFTKINDPELVYLPDPIKTFWAYLTNIAQAKVKATPPSSTLAVSFSYNDTYLAVSQSVSPRIYIYKRFGTTFTKLSNDSIEPVPENSVNKFSFSSDNAYLAVAHSLYGNPSRRLTIYKRSGNTFSDDDITISAQPPHGTNSVAFSPDDSCLAVTHNLITGVPGISIYQHVGDAFNKIGSPFDVPPSSGKTGHSVAFSNDGTYLAFGDTGSLLTIYRNNGNCTFIKLTDPDVLPPGAAKGIAFSSDSTYMAVAHFRGGNPQRGLTIYKYSVPNSRFEKLPDPASFPTDTGNGISFSVNDTYLTVVHFTSPFFTIYRLDPNDTFTKISSTTNPLFADSPTGTGNGVSFTTQPQP